MTSIFASLSQRHREGLTAGLTITLLYTLSRYVESRRRDVHVPAMGPSAWAVFYIGTVKFLLKGQELLREGVQKYKGDTFKVADLGFWHVVTNKPELIEEIQMAPEDKLSFNGMLESVVLSRWTIGPSIITTPYHVPVLLHQLTRNLGRIYDGIEQEIELAFSELFPAVTDEWTAVAVYKPLTEIVTRVNARAFVGLPFCRDPEYLHIAEHWTEVVVVKGQIINVLPDFLKPLANVVLRSTQNYVKRAKKILGPTIESRLGQFNEYGKDWPEKPTDLLQWLIEEAPEEERTVELLTRRILMMSFAGTHTITSTFIMALYDLASHPEYIEPLREEIESIVSEEGWSKASVMKMRKLESFLKESQRCNSIALLTLVRKVMVDYTLSDGTFLPAGSVVSVNADKMHNNDAHYPNASEFDGLRFVLENEGNGDTAYSQVRTAHLMATTSADFLAFGNGRHVCPGRFFAVTEMKTMMAYLLLNYDVKTVDGVRPKNIYMGGGVVPAPKAKLLFRRRASKA